MENTLHIKKCSSCGAMVKVLKNCTCDDCGIKCCGKEMQVLIPNSVDASVEKHVPQIEIVGDEVFVKVNHPMEKEHYIGELAPYYFATTGTGTSEANAVRMADEIIEELKEKGYVLNE